MTTKISFIYDNPDDPAAFDAGFPALLEQARSIPGVTKVESGKVWPKEDGSDTPLYRIVDLHFPDYQSASAAVASNQAGVMFPGVFALATGGVRVAFVDVDVPA